MVCSERGYKTLNVSQLINIFVAVIFDLQLFDAFRVLCAWLYLDAKDDATRRTLKKQGKYVGPKRYPRRAELREVVRGRKGVSTLLSKLEDVGVITRTGESLLLTETPVPGTRPFLELICGVNNEGELRRSARRPVPIPHEWLRAWASPTRARFVTLLHLFYCAAGLSFKSKRSSKVQNAARFKLSRLIDLLPVPAARVKRARRRLIQDGRITGDETYVQVRLNRLGHYFQVNLDWQRTRYRESPSCVGKNRAKMIPRPVQNCVETIPPNRDTKQAKLVRDQKRSGVSSKPGLHKPNIKNIELADLYDVWRLAELFKQQRWFSKSLANFQNFVAAAIRSRNLGVGSKGRDPVRVFVGIVRGQLWHHATETQEREAVRLVEEFREQARAAAVRRTKVSDRDECPNRPAFVDVRPANVDGSARRAEIQKLIEQSLQSVAGHIATTRPTAVRPRGDSYIAKLG